MRWAAVLLLATSVGGCGGTLGEAGSSGTPSYEVGRAAFERGATVEAIASLKAYVEQFPGTDLTDDALFLLGQAYLRTKDYALGSGQFDRLIRDFPSSPHQPEALFLLARCDDLLSRPAPLDQTESLRALGRYREFLELFPDHHRAAEARTRMEALRERLAEKRFRNGRLYFRLKQNEAAALYLRDLLVEFPRTRWADEATLLLAEILIRQGRSAEAADSLRSLERRVERDAIRRRAAERLRDLEGAGERR